MGDKTKQESKHNGFLNKQPTACNAQQVGQLRRV